MNNQRKMTSNQKWMFGLVAVFMLLGLVVGNMAFAANDVNEIIVDRNDDTKQNDGDCTLREAIIVANNGRATTGRECKILHPDKNVDSYTIILQAGSDTFQLTRTDNGNEDSSTTGDLDLRAKIHITSASPVVIEGGPGFSDRLFHILDGGKLTIERATLRHGASKGFGGAVFVEDGEFNFSNGTIFDNNAETSGGAVYNTGVTKLNYVTVIRNDVGAAESVVNGGLVNGPGMPAANFLVNSSYLDNNDCDGVFGGDASSNIANGSVDCPADPENPGITLTPFLSEGGSPVIFEIPPESKAVDNGINDLDPLNFAACPSTDQFGKARDQGDACDSGAFETDQVNLPPAAVDQNLTVSEDGEIVFSLNVTDDHNDVNWNITLVSGPSNGSLTGPDASNQFTYTPNPHYSGDDDGDYDDDSFTYEIYDGDGLGPATAVVDIEVIDDDFLEVTNVCDSGPGSLRTAIGMANDPIVTADIIIFDIFSDTSAPDYCGANTINLLSALPPLELPVTIDGLATETDTEFPVAGGPPYIVLDGACGDFNGLTIVNDAGGSVVANLVIQEMGGSGIVIGDVSVDGSGASNGNKIVGNVISGNGCSLTPVVNETDPSIVYNDGATVLDGVENRFQDNNIFDNSGESIDLKGDGPTKNDEDDDDGGPNYLQNYQHIAAASPGGVISGFLESVPTIVPGDPKMFALEFWTAPTCYADSAVPLEFTYVDTNTAVNPDDGIESVVTDDAGYVAYTINVSTPSLTEDYVVFGTARDRQGNTSEYSKCRPITGSNIVWTQSQIKGQQSATAPAAALNANAINALDPADFDIYDEVTDQAISEYAQSRWYKVENLKPDTTMIVELADMTVNLDLTLYSDIQAEYDKLVGPADPDLDILGAVAAPDWAAPDWAAPDWAAPDWAAPDWAAPDWADAGLAYEELAAPDWAAPDWAAPDWANTYYPPDVYPPDALVAAPDWAPENVASSWIDVDAYSSAQTVAIVGVSAFDGLAPERLVLRTFNNQGDYYIRVTGRNGAFDPANPFTLSMGIEFGVCQSLNLEVVPYEGTVIAGDYETLILVDEARMGAQYPAEMAALNAKLQDLAGATNGIVINVNEDGVPGVSKVAAANAIADAKPECIAAKNMVAQSVREIIKAYRAANPDIEYLLFIGNDDIIPNFRHPDQANLGSEENYEPPVEDYPIISASESQLRAGNFLSMDLYGASIDESQILSYKGDVLPLLEIAPARLVETPAEITAVIDAFLDLDDPNVPGISPLPVVLDSGDLGLSVGYDFMKDAAEAISDVFAGTGNFGPSTGLPVNELIGDDWTADHMIGVLSDTGNDPQIAYVGGHYVANGGVAADYKTYFYPQDVIDSPQDFANDLFFGNGCHMGYNIVDWHNRYEEGVLVTKQPDWAQAFASRGATLIAGTGYQYGDTDFIEYNERIYLELAKALRNGDGGGPISLGAAFVEAKHNYLAEVPVMRGIHQKSLMQTTIYGLPMLKYDLPGSQVPEITNPSIFSSEADLTKVINDPPGSALNLHTHELFRDYTSGSPGPLTEQPVSLMNIDTLEEVSAPYLVGPAPASLIQNNVTEPILPRDEVNVTVPPPSNMVLRGVGFRGGVYKDYKRGDEQDPATWKYILTGLSATELNGAHFGFLSDTMYPSAPWNINRFGALTEADPTKTGNTMLNVLPAQVQAPLPEPYETTLRQYDNMSFKLFFSDYTSPAGPNLPALASAPGIVKVEGLVNPDDSVTFNVQVVGDPSAGIHEVWVTYTFLGVPTLAGTFGEWKSLDLVQDETDSTVWSNPTTPLVLPPGMGPSDVRYKAQACTGTGRCTLVDNFGRDYIPGVDGEGSPTAVMGLSGPSSGAVGTEATFSATLVDVNNPGNSMEGLPLFFSVGSELRFDVTDVNGFAEATVLIQAAPGEYKVNATFPGDLVYAQGAAVPNLDFEILAQDTTLTWVPDDTTIITTDPEDLVVALTDVLGNPLAEKTVIYKLESPIETVYKVVVTDQEGIAPLGEVELQGAPTYSVSAEFGGTSSYLGSSTTAPGTLSAVEVVAVEYNDPDTPDDDVILPTIWPTNNKPIAIEVRLADEANTPLSYGYEFLLIEQDEKVKKGPDAAIENSCQTAWVLAERDGNGNGRVYRVLFQIDFNGTWLSGEGRVGTIPHDQSGDTLTIDDGPITGYYESADCPNPSS